MEPTPVSLAALPPISPGAALLRSLRPANVRRIWKLLRAVRFFSGHRYVFARAARNYFDIAVRGRRPLRVAELSLGNACQLHCAHCYATEVTQVRASLAQLESSIEALDRLGCLSIMLVGGEPTLRPDLPVIVAAIRKRRIVPFLFTNGLRLDRERIAELKQAGLFGVLVSLLGTGESHDRFVGHPGAYARALATLVAARDAGLFVSINTTATRESIQSGEFARLIEVAAAHGVGLKFNYPALLGRWAGKDDQLVDERERAILHQALQKPHVTNDMMSSYFDGACPAGHFAIYVADSGEVTPCAYIPISFGNVNQEPIEDIHERMRRSPVFGRIHRLCLVGEDREFIARYITPTFGVANLPMPVHEHPHADELASRA